MRRVAISLSLLSAVVVLLWAASAAADSSQQQQQSARAFSGWYSGVASFYGGPQDSPTTEYNSTISTGSCGYGELDPKLW
jgi:hypothetical protein